MMASNLMLQANFVDTNRPAFSITNVTAGQRVSNAEFIVKGTAGDNWRSATCVSSSTASGWNRRRTSTWTNWTAGVTLVPGTNTVAAYAVDTSGNMSVTNTVRFDFVATNLTVQLAGLGTITPNYSNALLQVGANYTMTAVVAVRGLRSPTGRVGPTLPLTVLTNGPILQFMMASNLVLQANFVDTNRPVSASPM